MVSPQFHVKHDERFETVKMNLPAMENIGKWQGVTQIHRTRPPATTESTRSSNKRRKTAHHPTSIPLPIMQPPQTEQAEANPQQREQTEPSPQQREHQSQQNESSPHQREQPTPNEPPIANRTRVQFQRESKGTSSHCKRGQKRLLEQPNKAPTSKGTTTSLEQRRKVLEAALFTYRTIIARMTHAKELAEDSITDNPMAFAATLANEDMMYLHEAQKQPDWDEFQEAMGMEINAHQEGGHWEVIPKSQMPKGHKIMRGVWSMKRKRPVGTGEIYKWKARLCIDGSSQQHGVNYWETYSPVVTWETIRSLLALAIINEWVTRQIDFVLAFPQAEVECPMYMEVPRGCNVDGSRDNYVLKLKKNLYGAKQGSWVWFNFLKQGLRKRGFKASKTDPAVFYKGSTIFIVYIDDRILIGPGENKINGIIESIKEDYAMTDEGDLNEYLGIKMERKGKARWLTQPALIHRILKAVNISEERKGQGRQTPCTTNGKKAVLSKDVRGPIRRKYWDYRSVVGMLNWLARSTRPDILFAVSQVGRFMAYPKKAHKDAVIRICKYL